MARAFAGQTSTRTSACAGCSRACLRAVGHVSQCVLSKPTMSIGASSTAVALWLAGTAGLSRAAPAQSDPLLHGAPAARWIAPPNVPGDSFIVFHARRAFDLPSAPAHFVV